VSDEEKTTEIIDESLAAVEMEQETEATEQSEAATETAAPEADLAQQLAVAQAETVDFRDRWLRTQAEFANARKRMDKERTELYTMATTEIVKKLLPIIDDFDRAMGVVPDEISGNNWFDGMELVQRKLAGVLEAVNVTTIDAVGQPFDPNYHEAISQDDSDEFESGHVCRELQKGYKIGDRVLRPSLVSVAS
jgi:molecular chaperone GrpE